MNATFPATAPAPQAQPIHAYLLLLAGCLSVLAAVLIAPNLPRIQAHFATVPQVEFLVPVMLTAPALVISVLSLFIGAFVDKVGRKRVLVVALLVYALFGIAPAWLDSLYVIVASRIGVGFAEAAIMTCATALIGDYFDGLRRERYLALNTTFASVSAVLFLTVGGALGEMGWRLPFYVYAISLLLAPLAQWLLWEPVSRASTQAAAHGSAIAHEGEDLPWRPALVAAICAITVVGAIGFMVIPVHLGFLLGAIGINSPQTIGLVAAAAQVAVVVGTFAFRGLLRVGLGVSVQLTLAFGILALGFEIAGSATAFLPMAAGAVISGIGGGIMLPTVMAWNMRVLPRAHRGLGTGAWIAAFFFGQFIAPVVVIGISRFTGNLASAVQLIGLALAIFAAIALSVRLFRCAKPLQAACA